MTVLIATTLLFVAYFLFAIAWNTKQIAEDLRYMREDNKRK